MRAHIRGRRRRLRDASLVERRVRTPVRWRRVHRIGRMVRGRNDRPRGGTPRRRHRPRGHRAHSTHAAGMSATAAGGKHARRCKSDRERTGTREHWQFHLMRDRVWHSSTPCLGFDRPPHSFESALIKRAVSRRGSESSLLICRGFGNPIATNAQLPFETCVRGRITVVYRKREILFENGNRVSRRANVPESSGCQIGRGARTSRVRQRAGRSRRRHETSRPLHAQRVGAARFISASVRCRRRR